MKRPRAGYDQPAEARAQGVIDFIKGLRFTHSLARLREHTNRRPCSKCGKNRLYYCYDCLTVVHPECHPPPLSLPLNVYVVLHPGEVRAKSTSLAASTISPDLKIIAYPSVPDLKPNETLVLYPSAESVTLEEVSDLENYNNVVFIDSTWQQSKSIARDERIKCFKHVRIPSQTSLFWRYQNHNPTYLATVEAIYYFLREYIIQLKMKKANSATKVSDSSNNAHPSLFYQGEVDDLLYYYINQYIGVQQRYSNQSESKEYTGKHFEGYILPSKDWENLIENPSLESHLGIPPPDETENK